MSTKNLEFTLGVNKELFTSTDPVITVFPRLIDLETGLPCEGIVNIKIEDTDFEMEVPVNELTQIEIPSTLYVGTSKTEVTLSSTAFTHDEGAVGESVISVAYLEPASYNRHQIAKQIKGESFLYLMCKGLMDTTVSVCVNYSDKEYVDLFGVSVFNKEIRFGVDVVNASLSVLCSSNGEDFTTIAETHIGHDRLSKILETGSLIPDSIVAALVNDLLNSNIGHLFVHYEFIENVIQRPITSDFSIHYHFLKFYIANQTKILELPSAFKRLCSVK